MKDVERTLKEAAGRLPADAPAALGARLPALAERAGLLDVAYSSVDTPLGRLMVAGTPRGLVKVAFPQGNTDLVLQDLAQRLSPRVLEAPGRLDDARRELEEYFEGRRQDFDLPIDWSLTQGFTRRVLRATARIGFGHLRTYTEVAGSAGSPRAVRAAGNALGSNPLPVVVPCHRVVRSGGGLGGYTGGVERKEYLLDLEGALPQAQP